MKALGFLTAALTQHERRLGMQVRPVYDPR